MNIEDFLPRLDRVKRTARGWMARCPAHADRSPSLSIREGDDGRVLLHDFGGCRVREICAALGIQVKDLFEDSSPLPARHAPRLQTVPLNELAGQLKLHADLLWLRAQDTFMAAEGLDTADWTDEDWDLAADAICSAYRDLERSDQLADAAYHARARWLKTRDERTKV